MKKCPRSSLMSALLTGILFGAAVTAQADTRLVSTDALATELIFALRADKYLVAVDVTSHLPPNYRPLKIVGYHRNLSAEGLLSLSPTLVIGSEHMGPAPALDALRQAGVTLLQLPSPDHPQQLRDNIQRVAEPLGLTETVTPLLARLDQQLLALESQPVTGSSAAFLLATDPTKLRLAGHGTTGEAFIRLTGGHNVADFTNYRTVSAESLLAMDPDIIILAGQEKDRALDSFLKSNPVLAHSRAARSGHIIAVDGSTLVAGLSLASIEEARQLTLAVKAD
ncbi:ABC transporter substrate-binding protein [Porticoccus sp.]|uniref:heme/hemin ABC transporter substrate-binding protein n=1 Tax=Porticoccus sp. TaxID=2024853 RepID=UPI000C4A6E6A|nr:ABC transporter substrate-binding protein [Porticoccus sp.]MAZ71021.1 ABC transporter substrate-binding protein [Porticoccus sp.]|tara:strand:- start:1874 stop:2716 length:843 start_codon:yes stop_codon:yes gene_type:complete